jgi:uncharacterized membrane protein
MYKESLHKMPWGIIFFIAGIVLLFNTGWFAGAGLVGFILLIFGAFSVLVQLAVVGLFAAVGKRSTRRRW